MHGGVILRRTGGTGIRPASEGEGPPRAHRRLHQRGRVGTETAFFITISTTFVNVPGAVSAVTIPPGQRALVKAQYDAESQCIEADTDGNWCSIRIGIGGVEGNPASGIDFAFDSTNRGVTSKGPGKGTA